MQHLFRSPLLWVSVVVLALTGCQNTPHRAPVEDRAVGKGASAQSAIPGTAVTPAPESKPLPGAENAGKPGHALTENDWLMAIRSRIGIPGGTCEFDLPAYFHWQHLPAAQRQAELAAWAQSLAPLAEALVLLLKMMRDTGTPQKVVAVGGQYQQNLPQGRSFQLLRLRIDPTPGLIPEISGNRLMFSVRLMRMDADQRLHPGGEDGSFELTLCA